MKLRTSGIGTAAVLGFRATLSTSRLERRCGAPCRLGHFARVTAYTEAVFRLRNYYERPTIRQECAGKPKTLMATFIAPCTRKIDSGKLPCARCLSHHYLLRRLSGERSAVRANSEIQ